MQVNTFHDTQTAVTHRPRSFGTLSYVVGGIDWARRVDIVKIVVFSISSGGIITVFFYLFRFFFIRKMWYTVGAFSYNVFSVLGSSLYLNFVHFFYGETHNRHFFSETFFSTVGWQICKATKFNWISFYDRKQKFA